MLPGQAHALQHGVDVVVDLLLVLHHMVGDEGLGDDVPHRHAGVEGGVGVLEDHLHLAANGLQLTGGQLGDVLAVQNDLARGGVIDADNGAGAAALAAAGLPHQAEGPALAQGEAHIVHRVDDAALACRKMFGQVLHLKDGLFHHFASFSAAASLP